MQKYAVVDVVPHSERMVLLDEILTYNDTGLTAALTVRDDSMFLNGQAKVPAWVGIEYMAQAISAWVGVQASLQGQPIRKGYLLGTRRYESEVEAFVMHETLHVVVSKVYENAGVGVFDCRIFSEDRLLVTAALNVYQPEDSQGL